MAVKGHLLGLLALVGLATAQQSVQFTDTENGINFQAFTDPVHNVTYAAVFPPLVSTGSNSTEFIGEIIAPIANQWVGLSIGGAMLNALLLVAWPNANAIVSSARFATAYAQPTVYAGPVLTTLPSSHVNATHWKWVFRCQNCTTWQGGSVNLGETDAWAWAVSTVAVNNPSDPASTFNEHTDFGFWGENVMGAHNANYQSYLSQTTSTTVAPTTTAKPTTTTTTTAKSTTTVKSTSTTTASTTTVAPPANPTSGTAAHYAQCGGIGFTGPTVCATPYTCQVSNAYYSQCL